YGASRFVKGDAIAGILIIMVNVVGGPSIGVGQHGMSWGEALANYTLLTVGDGIVTQIPALVIAIATGIIVTRAASDARLGAEVARQVLAHPRTIAILACTLLALAALPGIPIWPVAVLLPLTAGLYLYARRRGAPAAATKAPVASGTGGAEDLYRALKVDPVEVALGSSLLPLVGQDGAVLAE